MTRDDDTAAPRSSGPTASGHAASKHVEAAARDLGAELAEALADDAAGRRAGGGAGARSPQGTDNSSVERSSVQGSSSREPILIAWSGGLDSTVLLHLLTHDDRVTTAMGDPRIVVAHLDHAMRADSREAAAAVRRTAEAWGVECRTHRLAAAPDSEEEARTQRYTWLTEVADTLGAGQIWTAHHADDQAETVLFRALRGTGIAGLAGIPPRRGRLRRPFLMMQVPVRRGDLLRYAGEHDLPVWPDPSNDEPIATRNRLRNEAIPLLGDIVPGATDALIRLARNASRASEEADALAEFALRLADGAAQGLSGAAPSGAPDGIPADLWEEADRPLRRALARHLADRAGVALSEAATLALLALPPGSQSGRGVDLPGGLRFEREFDRWRLFRPTRGDAPSDRRERIEISAEGTDSVRAWFGGRQRKASWSTAESESGDPGPDSVRLDVPESAFPLALRGWEPGDRIARSFGTTPVAKAWSEARVPRRERPRRWVLVDREGTVLAAEGLGAARRDHTIEGSNTTHATLHLRLDVEE